MVEENKGWKIPILWRIERFIKVRVIDKQKREKKSIRGKYASKKRAYGTVCNGCGNEKWFKRKNSMKCTKCGYKVYIMEEPVN